MYIRNFLTVVFLFLTLTACGNKSDSDANDNDKPVVTSSFAKGADVSWLTEMEASGKKFYDASGNATECMTLLKSLGMNSIRLRVWVNPSDGWCNKADLLVKAKRANTLGMKILLDFHYSDSWADPSKQNKPSAWVNDSFEQLKAHVSAHTTEVLNALKSAGIYPAWVQVGNETGNGMLWPDGKADVNMAQYAALNNAGYDAVKAVMPDAKVIVHLQTGNDTSLFTWLFDGLKAHGGKWDVIGMSLYPTMDNWESVTAQCVANISTFYKRYGTDVMVCEVGMPWNLPSTTKKFLSAMLTGSSATGHCLGVFYWEPEAYNSWKQYELGAFDNSGKATEALSAFN